MPLCACGQRASASAPSSFLRDLPAADNAVTFPFKIFVDRSRGAARRNHGLHGRVENRRPFRPAVFASYIARSALLAIRQHCDPQAKNKGHANAGCTGIFIRIELKTLKSCENFSLSLRPATQRLCFLRTEIGEKNDKFIAAEAATVSSARHNWRSAEPLFSAADRPCRDQVSRSAT